MIFSPLSNVDRSSVTQGFGSNPEHYRKYGLSGHNGCDLRCSIGTPLYAPCEGYITIGDEGGTGYGKFVKITSKPYRDGMRREITLGHLSRFMSLPVHAFVAAGDLVGISGNSGDSSGPHVHVTYKILDEQGAPLNNDNGYHGAIDVSNYMQAWILHNTFGS